MNLNKYKPSVVIVGSDGTKLKSLLELITQSSDVKEDGAHRLFQSWKIDTKYYTADIDIHGITEHYKRSNDFIQAVKAVIIYIDCKNESALSVLNKWDVIVNECDPEVKLLISDYCNDETKITLKEATEWCLGRGFEFIVLQPNIEDEVEDFKEKVGVDRIVEALHSYVWPNLELKKENDVRNEGRNLKLSSNEQLNDVFGMLKNEEMDDFTELFGQLHMMKQSIQSLPSAERKLCAEEMVTAFWKAIGGDEEELEDL